jgi:HK97 family phage portal protein
MKSIGLLDRLNFLFNKSKLQEVMAAYAHDFIAGEDVRPIENYNAIAFSAVFACFRVLAETFASVPVLEYKRLEKNERERTDDTGLYKVLHGKPNELMSSYNFAEAMMYQLNSGGNAIAIKLKNYAGDVVGLFPIEWDRVRIEFNKEKNVLEYEIDRKDKYTRDQIFHVPGPSMNGVIGMSILEYAAQAINLGMTYEKFGNSFYRNGALPSGIFEHPQTLNPQAFDRLKENLKKNYTGLKNAGVPMILEDGLKFNQLTMKLVDAEFLSSRKFEVEEICRFCRVPLHLVQSLDRSTFSNIEHQSLEFVMYTMLPHFRRFEEAINQQLLTPEQREDGYFFEYNIDALVRGDMKSRYDAYGVGRQNGFLSVNDIRSRENMSRIKNGDIYLQPLNMTEAGKAPVQQQQVEQKQEMSTTEGM